MKDYRDLEREKAQLKVKLKKIRKKFVEEQKELSDKIEEIERKQHDLINQKLNF